MSFSLTSAQAIPSGILPRNPGSKPLAKRILLVQIGSPFTQVKAGSSLLIVGENMSGSNPSYNLTASLDSTPLGAFPNVPFTGDTFRIHVTIPSTTTDGTHTICVANLAEQTQYCMEMLVCSSNCHPTLGFLDSDELSSPSATRLPSDPSFTLVGDAFGPNESLSLSVTTNVPVFGDFNIPLMDVTTDGTGRFEQTFEVFGLSLGAHTINVKGKDSEDSASAQFTLSNVVDF